MTSPPPLERSSILVALVMGAALSAMACDMVTSRRTTEQIIPVTPGTAVHVTTRNGWIHVRPGRVGFVSLRAHGRVKALRGGERRLDQINTRVRKQGGVLRIRGHHPKDPAERTYQLSLTLTVPRRTHLTLETDRGYLDVADLSGDVSGSTGEGEIRVQDVSGALDLRTGAGNILASGKLERLHLETRVGEIQVTLSPGAPLAALSRVLSNSGAVTLTLPPDLRATVTAESRSGQVDSDIPAQSKRPGWLRALVSGGGPQISLVSHRGAVRIRTKRLPRRLGRHLR